MAIKVNQLTSEILRGLNEYTEEVKEKMEKSADKNAKKGAEKLRTTSPKRTGAYGKSWTKKKEGNAHMIHNKDHYQLTHLLENGHVTRNGGRTREFKHIAPVEKEVVQDYISDVERAIKGG